MTNNELIRAMDRLGMSNMDLARIVRRTPRAVGNWCSGSTPIPGSIALIIDAMLKGELSINWVIDYTNKD